ncbi:DNRLRE domain-containing protein [Labilibacter sediminis]|nr:DNRLRE domain-containing protein [Labilibacter sediminis]
MKTLVIIFSVLLLAVSSNSFAGKPVKVKVSQDAFVQGGETSDEAFGLTKDGRLRVMKSNGTDKYSRISYLQFNLKKIESIESATLNLCVRVFPSKNDASAQFSLNVYACENNKWSETGITFDNKPEKAELLATEVLPVNDDNSWISISIPADKLKALKEKSKKGKVTLVLANDDFNRTSIEVISKERTWSNGMAAKREAYLKILP